MMAVWASAAEAGQRLALIITNQDYSSAIGILENTHRDGDLVKAGLEQARFTVTVVRDATAIEIERAVADFAARLAKANETSGDAVGFFYYSGHGASEASSREDYLVPARTPIADANELASAGVKLSAVLNAIGTAGNKHNFAVFDACRDAPFTVTMKGLTKGLVPRPKLDPSILVAYAAVPNSTASDDGAYATALAEEMARTPGTTANYLFHKVRQEVGQRRNRNPEGYFVDDRKINFSDVLNAEFYFQPPAADRPVLPREEARQQAWIAEQSWDATSLYFMTGSRYYKTPDRRTDPIGEIPAGTQINGKVERGSAASAHWYKYRNLFGQEVYSNADEAETLGGR